MDMNNKEKEIIAQELEYQASLSSQNKIAVKVKTSPGTVSQMIGGLEKASKWDLIDESMWRRVKVGLKMDTEWNVVETSNFTTLTKALLAVQKKSMSIGISENAGIGKSETYKQYARKYKNVIHVECKHYWSKKSYMKTLLNTVGLEAVGTTEELIESFVSHVMGLHHPIMIIDQADKLKDPQLDLFMDFYNDLFNHCGFVLSGVKALRKRIEKGVQRDKPGYREIYSRIGSKFYTQLKGLTKNDVSKICNANGVDDEVIIAEIFNISDGDIRKVRREVEKQGLARNAA